MAITRLWVWLPIIIGEVAKIPQYNQDGERLLRSLRIALSLWLFALLATALPAAAAPGGGVPVEAVRVLAENVLGAGAVTSVRVSDGGAQVFMRWESATFKPTNGLAATRELIYAEAQLATGSVMSQLGNLVRIRFTILSNGQMLATGQNWRGHGVAMMFSTQIGGGAARPTSPTHDPAQPRGGEPAREL